MNVFITDKMIDAGAEILRDALSHILEIDPNLPNELAEKIFRTMIVERRAYYKSVKEAKESEARKMLDPWGYAQVRRVANKLPGFPKDRMTLICQEISGTVYTKEEALAALSQHIEYDL